MEISFLHEYEQYFVENFEKDVRSLMGCESFDKLYDRLNLNDKISNIYSTALSTLSLKIE
jgi:hypothetical protein